MEGLEFIGGQRVRARVLASVREIRAIGTYAAGYEERSFGGSGDFVASILCEVHALSNEGGGFGGGDVQVGSQAWDGSLVGGGGGDLGAGGEVGGVCLVDEGWGCGEEGGGPEGGGYVCWVVISVCLSPSSKPTCTITI